MSQPPLPEAQRTTGTHLYKYGSNVDWLKDLILHHKLFIPTVTQLNDPNDSRPRMRRLTRRELVRFLARMHVSGKPELAGHEPEVFAAIAAQAAAVRDDEALYRETVMMFYAQLETRRIYSMSTRWNNLKMWAQYANNHAGYCLEFDNDDTDPLFRMARTVIYDDSLEMDLTRRDHVKPVWYLLKHPDWRCEEEVRIVVPTPMGGPVFTIAPHILNRVIIGRNMPPADVKRIRDWATRRSPALDVAVTTYDEFTRTFGVVPLTHG